MELKCTKDFCGILKKLGFFRVLKIAEKIRCYLFWNIFFVEVSLRLSFSAGPQGNAWFVAAFFHSWLQQTLTLTRARLHTHQHTSGQHLYTYRPRLEPQKPQAILAWRILQNAHTEAHILALTHAACVLVLPEGVF